MHENLPTKNDEGIHKQKQSFSTEINASNNPP